MIGFYEMIRIVRDDEAQWFVASIQSEGGVIAEGISYNDAADMMRVRCANRWPSCDVAIDRADGQWFVEVKPRRVL